jgi:IS5 family transposase
MTGFERYTKKTRRAQFLDEMGQVVPWAKLCALIEPHKDAVSCAGNDLLRFSNLLSTVEM